MFSTFTSMSNIRRIWLLPAVVLISCQNQSASEIAQEWCRLKKLEIQSDSLHHKKKYFEKAGAYARYIDREYRNHEEMKNEIRKYVRECETELEQLPGKEYDEFEDE